MNVTRWRSKALAIAVAVALFAVGLGMREQKQAVEQQREAAERRAQETAAAKANADRLARCTIGSSALTAQARAALKSDDPYAAVRTLSECGDALTDLAALALLKQAQDETVARDARVAASAAAAKSAAASWDSWAELTASALLADKKLVAYVQGLGLLDACEAWGKYARSGKDDRTRMALVLYLKDRGFINGPDLANVTSRDRPPEIGMTFCGVIAEMGWPDHLNQSKTAKRHRSQMVYRGRGINVYTEGDNINGIVTSVQF